MRPSGATRAVKHESITRMRASDSTMQRERPPGGLLPSGPKRAWMIGGVAVLAACLLVVIALVVANSGSSKSPALQGAASDSGGAPSAPAGFTQVFLDNFAGPKGAPP